MQGQRLTTATGTCSWARAGDHLLERGLAARVEGDGV